MHTRIKEVKNTRTASLQKDAHSPERKHRLVGFYPRCYPLPSAHRWLEDEHIPLVHQNISLMHTEYQMVTRVPKQPHAHSTFSLSATSRQEVLIINSHCTQCAGIPSREAWAQHCIKQHQAAPAPVLSSPRHADYN